MFNTDEKTNSIYMYGVIGESFWDEGITAGQVLRSLDSMRDNRVTVYINSPGGQADEGVAIYNILRRHPGGVDTVVDSLAASAASIIALAGQSRRSMTGSRWMIHRAMTIAIGNHEEMRAVAKVLETYDTALSEIYSGYMGASKEEILQAMTAETWYTSEEAVTAGLATAMEAKPATQAAQNAAWFSKPPQDLLTAPQARLKPIAANRWLAKLAVKCA